MNNRVVMHPAIAAPGIFAETNGMSRRPAALFVLLAALSARAVPPEPRTPPAPAGRPGENFTIAHAAMAMIWIRPGTFLMSGTLGDGDDTVVTITRGYWLGQTEVTQAQWQIVAEGIPVYRNIPLPSHFRGSNRPVENMTWDMAAAFCARLTEVERAAGRLPPGYEYQLPTEAQWEYACRAGTSGAYPGKLDDIAWYEANSGGETHPVAQKQPNAWGLYDMCGNVGEWCADWYGGYPGGRVHDPAGPRSGNYRVIRGGTGSGPAGVCRSAFRTWLKPDLVKPWQGFRVALAPAREPAAAADGGKR
jgi:formylglycine-generating enzyme required for sulfatase activity